MNWCINIVSTTEKLKAKLTENVPNINNHTVKIDVKKKKKNGTTTITLLKN